MRVLNIDANALLGTQFALAVLVELDLTVPLYYATCRDSIEWAGKTYVGGSQGGIDQVKDQGGEVVGLSFSLSGVPASLIAVALAEPIQGKAARISLAIMDPDTQAIVDVLLLWTGNCDQMPIREQGDTATITVTCEHRGIVFARPKGILYSDAEQQALHPGDKCLEYLASQASHLDVWPAASWSKV